MKVAMVAAEIAPWAKVGGLADVIGALPGALKAAGAEPSIIVPGYAPLLDKLETRVIVRGLTVRVGANVEYFNLLRGEDRAGVPIYAIDHTGYFSRKGIYGEGGGDYSDNIRRYVFFGRAASAVAETVGADVIHAHDWHSAVAPIVIRGHEDLRARFANTVAVITIHNLAFQGICDAADFALLGIDKSYFGIEGLEFFGRVNLLKGAIVLCDGVSTVSPTYAREITAGSEMGFGLEGVLRNKGDRLVGILNGADYEEWNPAHDKNIAHTFTPDLREAKRECKRDLCARLGLDFSDTTPIIGMVTRMTSQKGVGIVAEALERVMALGVELAMLASGDPALEKFFADAQARYPGRLRVALDFDNVLAHRIQAGADAFLMPSRFEPCGLTQMYALKYGTAPIVRATGGLRDTVVDFNPASGVGNGFVFEDLSAAAMTTAIERMCAAYRDRAAWRRLMTNAFAADFSWARAAQTYLAWYDALKSARR
jgi:starch synthase